MGLGPQPGASQIGRGGHALGGQLPNPAPGHITRFDKALPDQCIPRPLDVLVCVHVRIKYEEHLPALEGAAKTQGQSVPSDLNVVRADLVLYGVMRGLHDAIVKLDRTSTRLFVVNICLSFVMALLTIVQICIAVRR